MNGDTRVERLASGRQYAEGEFVSEVIHRSDRSLGLRLFDDRVAEDGFLARRLFKEALTSGWG